MGDYLVDLFFDPVPKDVRGKYKLLIYLIRLSEALILVGVGWVWQTSKAFGAEHTGGALSAGRVILVLLVASSIISWWRPFRVRMSQYAWGMAFVGVVTFLLAYDARNPGDGFVPGAGPYITMAGGVLRFVLGYWLGHQLEKEEKAMAMLGLDPATLATPGTEEKDPTA
jgi:hypothetical protein